MFFLVYLAISEPKTCSNESKIYDLDNMSHKLSIKDNSFCIYFDFQNNIPRNNILSINFASMYNYTIEVYDVDSTEIKFSTTIKYSTVMLNQTAGFIKFTPSNTTDNTIKSIVMTKTKITRNIMKTLSEQKYINIKRCALKMMTSSSQFMIFLESLHLLFFVFRFQSIQIEQYVVDVYFTVSI